MKLSFEGDALWGPCPDGGNLNFINGEPVRSGGLSGAVYISLVGGNQLDDGTPESKLQWWGNYLETDANRQFHGRTGTLLAGLPMTSGNLRRVEQAAQDDLQWMLDAGVATEITVAAAIVSNRFIELTIDILAFGRRETFQFRENWTAGAFEPVLSCG